MIPGIESLACGPLAVPDDVMAHVVHVESSRNPFAIGVVGGRLLRQPRNLGEAVATVRMLEARGYNYSVGLAQVNRVNFERFGLEAPEAGFDVCNNLAAGATILAECLQRHDGRWGDAFSCYYSGNARTGYEHGYVQKVFDAMTSSASPLPEAIGLSVASTEASPAPAYAARVTAPHVSRVVAVSRTQPTNEPAPDLVAASGRVESAEAMPEAPEARFIAEIRQRAARMDGQGDDVPTTTVEAPSMVDAPAIDVAPAALLASEGGLTQEESNSSKADAARVF